MKTRDQTNLLEWIQCLETNKTGRSTTMLSLLLKKKRSCQKTINPTTIQGNDGHYEKI